MLSGQNTGTTCRTLLHLTLLWSPHEFLTKKKTFADKTDIFKNAWETETSQIIEEGLWRCQLRLICSSCGIDCVREERTIVDVSRGFSLIGLWEWMPTVKPKVDVTIIWLQSCRTLLSAPIVPRQKTFFPTVTSSKESFLIVIWIEVRFGSQEKTSVPTDGPRLHNTEWNCFRQVSHEIKREEFGIEPIDNVCFGSNRAGFLLIRNYQSHEQSWVISQSWPQTDMDAFHCRHASLTDVFLLSSWFWRQFKREFSNANWDPNNRNLGAARDRCSEIGGW
jgi:hypothetical protein